MSLKELFPTYPFTLLTPPKSRIKFGSRRLYVDLPWQTYYFLRAAMDKAVESGLTKEEVRVEWHKFLQAHKDILTLHGKPFVSISLRSPPFSERPYLRLDVKWDLFIEYLEEKAINLLSEMDKREMKSIKEVYREVWTNYFTITDIFTDRIIPPEPTYFPSTRERFKKLLRRTGDWFYIEGLLSQLEEVIKQLEEEMKDEVPLIQLYTTNLMMDIQHLRALMDVVNIPAAYLLLRNLLENFIKLFVYLKIGSSIDPDIVLYSTFLYEYETSGQKRIYSLNRFEKEWIRKFLKIFSDIPHDKELYLLEIIERFKEKKMPTLGVNPEVSGEISQRYGLEDTNLDKIYSICSFVIHNQPPLPFFSLLEVKFFKHFLRRYVNSLQIMVEKLIRKKIEVKDIHENIPIKSKSINECLNVVHTLWTKYDSEIKSMIRKGLKEVRGFWVRPLTLAAIFHLINPSFTQLKKHLFTQEDLKDIVEKLRPISFRIGLDYEVYDTLNALQEILFPVLEKYEEFSSLQSNENKKTVLFYLLLLYLPEMIMEVLKEE